MARSIKLTTTYSHPIASVWEALTNSAAMSQWLMPCDIKPEVGHHFQFRTKPSIGFKGIVDCTVLEVEHEKKLSISWSAGGLKNTRVDFILEAKGDQTILHFEHSGFEGFMNNLIARRILAAGWKTKILTVQLPKYLNHE